MKPIIGIVEWPYTDKDGDLIYEVVNSVIEKVSEHGGIPIGIFPTQIEDYQNKKIKEIKKLTLDEKDDLNQSLKICDAIIKPGALRIYGYERYIYNYVFEKNMPYIGICAGMQLMAFHKREINNIKNPESNIIHHSKEEYAHEIKIEKGTLLYSILKKDEIMVNSRHNYHISDAGINKVSAYSQDGIIEAIENSNKDFQIGLQWHPEMLNDENTDNIFETFMYEAKKYRLKRK